MHIGLHYEQGVIFFLFRIDGTWAWSDQAFSIHLVSEADRGPGEPSDNAFVPLTVVLVDSNTGRVAALRMVTMSPRFASTFRGLIDKQRANPFDPEAHKRTIAALYTKYRTSKDLADAALLQERAALLLFCAPPILALSAYLVPDIRLYAAAAAALSLLLGWRIRSRVQARQHGQEIEATFSSRAIPELEKAGFTVESGHLTRYGDIDLIVRRAGWCATIEIKSFRFWRGRLRDQARQRKARVQARRQ